MGHRPRLKQGSDTTSINSPCLEPWRARSWGRWLPNWPGPSLGPKGSRYSVVLQ